MSGAMEVKYFHFFHSLFRVSIIGPGSTILSFHTFYLSSDGFALINSTFHDAVSKLYSFYALEKIGPLSTGYNVILSTLNINKLMNTKIDILPLFLQIRNDQHRNLA